MNVNGKVWSCFREKLSCTATTIFILFSTHMLLPSLGQPRSFCSCVVNWTGKFLVCTNHYPKKEEGWELSLSWVISSLVFIETWAGMVLEAGACSLQWLLWSNMFAKWQSGWEAAAPEWLPELLAVILFILQSYLSHWIFFYLLYWSMC